MSTEEDEKLLKAAEERLQRKRAALAALRAAGSVGEVLAEVAPKRPTKRRAAGEGPPPEKG